MTLAFIAAGITSLVRAGGTRRRHFSQCPPLPNSPVGFMLDPRCRSRQPSLLRVCLHTRIGTIVCFVFTSLPPSFPDCCCLSWLISVYCIAIPPLCPLSSSSLSCGRDQILSIRKVLFHELAHNDVGPHNDDFYRLMRQVRLGSAHR